MVEEEFNANIEFVICAIDISKNLLFECNSINTWLVNTEPEASQINHFPETADFAKFHIESACKAW